MSEEKKRGRTRNRGSCQRRNSGDGQVMLEENSGRHRIHLLTIIGEVEGHESAPSHSKTTKYEHVLPKLAMIEDDRKVDGLLVLLNTVAAMWRQDLPSRR